MVLDGYDHIIDVTDADGSSIAELARSRGHPELSEYLDNVQEFADARERLLQAVRDNEITTVEEILSRNDAAKLARAKNYYGETINFESTSFNYFFTGRCCLHIAVLMENEEIVEYIANNFRQSLRVGDNVSIIMNDNENFCTKNYEFF